MSRYRYLFASVFRKFSIFLRALFIFGGDNRVENAKLYVGNLSFQTTDSELQTLFEQAGGVESVNIITDRDTGRSRGFGFVEMDSPESAQAAIEKFNDYSYGERNLVVNVAKKREERSGGGGGGRGRF